MLPLLNDYCFVLDFQVTCSLNFEIMESMEKFSWFDRLLNNFQVLLCRKGKRKEMEHNMKSVVEGKKRKINDIVSNSDQGQQDHGPTDITGLLAKELALEEQKIEEFTLPLESSVIQIHTGMSTIISFESVFSGHRVYCRLIIVNHTNT